MKLLIVGGHGAIGKTLTAHFKKDNEVIIAGRSNGDIEVDITDSSSITRMFDVIGNIDAIICAAGDAKWATFENLTEDDYYIGFRSKLMGQVNLTRLGYRHLNEGGSITLTTGILAEHPVPKTASAAMVNGAIHSFVKATALELQRDVRLNAVAAGMVQDTYEKYKDYFPGHTPVSMEKVVSGYEQSVLGSENGTIIKIYN